VDNLRLLKSHLSIISAQLDTPGEDGVLNCTAFTIGNADAALCAGALKVSRSR
jgi:hypothetical protein